MIARLQAEQKKGVVELKRQLELKAFGKISRSGDQKRKNGRREGGGGEREREKERGDGSFLEM
jgi:hypothetical protein